MERVARHPAPVLGTLEGAVMDKLWQTVAPGSHGLTVREVHDSVGVERSLAYTTLMTVLDRLSKKGFVQRHRDGRAWRYVPTWTAEQLAATRMRFSLHLIEGADRRATLAHFLDGATAEEITELKAAIRSYERRAARAHAAPA